MSFENKSKIVSLKPCAKCDFLSAKDNICVAGSYGSPLRKCLSGLLTQEFRNLSHTKIVVEIGCGTWDFTKRIVEAKNAKWFGVEPALCDASGNPSIATHVGKADQIPFPDESIDYLISSQCIEHWHEFGTSFSNGIAEAWRVLKDDGILSINFPLNFHGHKIFLRSKQRAIIALLPKPYWKNLQFEIWRSDARPLPEFYGNPKQLANRPAKIGVIRAFKKRQPHPLRSVELRKIYVLSGEFSLINPVPIWRSGIKRFFGQRYLHAKVK